MAAAGKLRSPRGDRDIYLHTQTGPSYDNPKKIDYYFNAESDLDANARLVGVPQATLDEYEDADFNTVEDGGANTVLVYNPITETYDIKPGEYVL